MHAVNVVADFFISGGPIMALIAIVLAFGLAIAIERWWFLRRAAQRNRKEWDRLAPLINAGDYERARSETAASETEISTILNYGLERLRTSTEREDVESALEESLMETTPRLERRTHYLATLANVALLLGLLGTVIGLIDAFAVVASANLAHKTKFLFEAIAVTMNNTAFGLMVSIPLLLIHMWLATKTSRIVDSMEVASVKLLNTVSSLRHKES